MEKEDADLVRMLDAATRIWRWSTFIVVVVVVVVSSGLLD